MATYAIGDIQGCYKTLKRLLKRFSYNPKLDRIFLAGDLVNRGPDSLSVLRWAHDQGPRLVAVLGNHDLHLIAHGLGVGRGRFEKSLAKVLAAKDGDQLIDWLRHRPLLHCEGRVVMVHAGILPAWSVNEAARYAQEVERELRSKACSQLLFDWYHDDSLVWQDDLQDSPRTSMILNVFCRMRLCKSANELEFSYTGEPENAPKGFKPWFMVPGRKNADHTIIFGHWAALGLRVFDQIVSLDSGCVWGRSLSAMRLEDGAIFSEPSAE